MAKSLPFTFEVCRPMRSPGISGFPAVTSRKPLRFLVDLTPMLMASDQLQVPAGYSYQVRFDFLSWRVTGEVDENLFTYTPSKDAKEYKSLEDYYESVAGVVGEHPLLGKPAPEFVTETLDGKKFSSKDFAGKVVVLDFWATWCCACVAAMPILKEVTDQFADEGVVFLAINTGEEKKEIEDFLKAQKLDVNVALRSRRKNCRRVCDRRVAPNRCDWKEWCN